MTTEFDYFIICEDTAEDLSAAVTDMLRSGYETVGAPFTRNTDTGLFWYQAVERALNP